MNSFHQADRVSRLRPTAVNRVLHEVRQLQAEGRSVVSLMRGQPDTPTPPHIVEAAARALRDGRTGYPDNQGEPVLRRAVAEKLQREQNLTLRSRSRDPGDGWRNAGHLYGPGRARATGRVGLAARPDL